MGPNEDGTSKNPSPDSAWKRFRRSRTGKWIKWSFACLLGIPVALFVVGYFFGIPAVVWIDARYPEYFDAKIGTDRKHVERIIDPTYFTQGSDVVSEDLAALACVSAPEHRILIRDPADIPPFFRQAVLASEDKHFLDHPGVDKDAVLRAAFFRYVLHVSRSGASTPTMQLAKELRGGTGRKSTEAEKLRDMLTALRIERELSKEQILVRYVNYPFVGRGQYGIEAGARVYFGKPAKDLKVYQAAFIVSLIPRPGLPFRNFATDPETGEVIRGLSREEVRKRNWRETKQGVIRVLRRMREDGHLDPDAYAAAADAVESKLDGEIQKSWVGCGANGYYMEAVRQEVIRQGFRVDKGNLVVPVPFDPGMQQALEGAVTLTRETYKERHKDDHDLILAGAIIVDFRGRVRAEVGNIDWANIKHDAVRQSWRHAGSTAKVVTYGAAMERIVADVLGGEDHPETLDDIVAAALRRSVVETGPAVVYLGRGRGVKIIRNYQGPNEPKFSGKIPFKTAIGASVNTAAMHAGRMAGPKNVLGLYKRLGILDDVHSCDPYPTIAIGACEVNPRSMTGVGAFANGGYLIVPRFTNDICRDGFSLLGRDERGLALPCDTKGERAGTPLRVVHPAVAFAMVEVLKGPLDYDHGTARSLRRGTIPGVDIHKAHLLPLAERKARTIAFSFETSGEILGKTGTATNADGRTSDVWLIIMIPGPPGHPEDGLVIVAWMGKDSKTHPLDVRGSGGGSTFLSETGGRNWVHSFATVLQFLQKERGYLKPGYKFVPMFEDDVLRAYREAREAKVYTAPAEDIIPDPDGSDVERMIDPDDPGLDAETREAIRKAEEEAKKSEEAARTAQSPADPALAETPPDVPND